VSDVDYLEILCEAIFADLCFPGQVPVMSVTDEASEWRKSVLCALSGDAGSELVQGWEIGEIKADRGFWRSVGPQFSYVSFVY